MDSNSITLTLIIINLIMNFLTVLDHFLSRIKRSKCWGTDIDFYRDNKQDNQNQDIKKINFEDLIKAFRDLRKDDSDYNDEEKNKSNKL